MIPSLSYVMLILLDKLNPTYERNTDLRVMKEALLNYWILNYQKNVRYQNMSNSILNKRYNLSKKFHILKLVENEINWMNDLFMKYVFTK